MPRKAQRAGNNTATHASQVFMTAGQVPVVPTGFNQDREGFAEVWVDYTRARTLEDWLPSDLRIMAKIVMAELDIRELSARRDAEGWTIENKRGTEIENPVIRIIDVLTRQQLAMIRSLSLTAGAVGIAEKRTAAKNDIKAAQAKDELSDSLLAN